MVTMKEIIKYFDNKNSECIPEKAFKIVQQKLDDQDKLIEEQVFFRSFP